MLIAGLMTGTSLDGIDVVVVEVEGETIEELRWRVAGSTTTSHPPERRERIHREIASGSAEGIAALHAELGEWLAQAVIDHCDRSGMAVADLDLIGSHGQTIWHRPPAEGKRGATLQIGCPATIAERTGVAVVSDFRARDVAAGGHGAPLVPWVDRVLFAEPDRVRALQNLGGIGNVTRVPRRGSEEEVLAFDTGPGNALIDAVVTLATRGRLGYDRDGALAARGQVDEELLSDLMRHPYFGMAPPKSTGREVFGRQLVERLVAAIRPEGDEDWLSLVATVTELTARSVAEAYRRWVLPLGLDEVVVTGGGALNPTLMSRLQSLLEPVPVRDGRVLGIEATEKEALAFAILAWAHVRGIPANERAATGASGPRVLGSYTPGASGNTRR